MGLPRHGSATRALLHLGRVHGYMVTRFTSRGGRATIRLDLIALRSTTSRIGRARALPIDRPLRKNRFEKAAGAVNIERHSPAQPRQMTLGHPFRRVVDDIKLRKPLFNLGLRSRSEKCPNTALSIVVYNEK